MAAKLYLASFVVGAILLGASLFGDLLDADSDADTDGMRILTMRSATYFAFVFGLTGIALTWLAGGIGAAATLGIATAAGIGTAFVVGRIFGWVKQSEAGEVEGDDTLQGLLAEVVVPLSRRYDGKIAVRRGGERLELLARPFDEQDGDPAAWHEVVIIEVRHGTALVSPGALEARE